MLKCVLLESIFLHIQGLNCRESIYELEYHVEHETLSLNLLPKLKFVKRIFRLGFPNHLLKNI